MRISDWSSDVCSSDLAERASSEVDPPARSSLREEEARDQEPGEGEEQRYAEEAAAGEVELAVEREDADQCQCPQPIEGGQVPEAGAHPRGAVAAFGSTGASRPVPRWPDPSVDSSWYSASTFTSQMSLPAPKMRTEE